MAIKNDLSVSSCWIVTEGLSGLQNQAIGLAQALGLSYVLKEIKKSKGLRRFLPLDLKGFAPPWPDLLITCGRQSVRFSLALRRASKKKTFTVHIHDPLVDRSHFDVVIVPAHDRLRGENVLVTRGAIHHVNAQRLNNAAEYFRPLLARLPRPLISVLVGGKNGRQSFTASGARDFAKKLLQAAKNTGSGLAVSFSQRTGAANESILRKALVATPSYIWDNQRENPYFGLLGLADVIVVTSDSVSMISEACSTGKPVYIYELPNGGKRHKQFCESLIRAGMARPFLGDVENWKYTPLDETQKAASFVYERYLQRSAYA